MIREVLRTVPNVGYSVSFTTRTPRAGEEHGRHYFFVSPEEFTAMRERGDFLESAKVHGNFYGTSRSQVEKELNDGRDVILEIDVQGATSVKALVPEAVGVFILPPSFEVLRARLTNRGSENLADLALRIQNAPGEIECYRAFDYIIINDEVMRAAAQLAAIFMAERARRERMEDAAQEILQTFITKENQ